MMPPLMTVGSIPAQSSMAAMIEVVVVLPWVPATATDHLSRISSASISARCTTGMWRSPAATISTLSSAMADETTSTATSSMVSAPWPWEIGMPSARRRRTVALSAMSLPWTR